MKTDPPMKKKGGAYVCATGCGGKLNALTISNGDPFCQTACANEWHGFEPLSRRYTLSGNQQGYTGHTAPAKWDDGARHRARRRRERGE